LVPKLFNLDLLVAAALKFRLIYNSVLNASNDPKSQFLDQSSNLTPFNLHLELSKVGKAKSVYNIELVSTYCKANPQTASFDSLPLLSLTEITKSTLKINSNIYLSHNPSINH